MKVLLSGCFLDYSGYGEMARYILSSISGVEELDLYIENIKLQNVNFYSIELRKMLAKKIPNDIDVHIVMMIPKFFTNLKGKYNIGFTMFEAGGDIPTGWAASINKLDAVFVPSAFNKESFLAGGVNKPIHIVTIAPNDRYFSAEPKTEINSNKLYSIFQWIDRKNPECLIKAFAKTALQNKDKKLLLKTFVNKQNNPKENELLINKEISLILDSLNLSAQDKNKVIRNIIVNTENSSEEDIYNIHKFNDVFVLPHKGEGWGLPIHEALLFNNCVVTTDFAGASQFVNSFNSYIIDYSLQYSNNTGFFNSNMFIAEPSCVDLFNKIKAERLYNKCNVEQLRKYFNKENTKKEIMSALKRICV